MYTLPTQATALPRPTASGLIQSVLDWGRQQTSSHTIDQSGHFDRQQTETIRRALRHEFTHFNYDVVGSWRQGYEMTLDNERVGVTNGHGPFKVYYRRMK